MNWDTDLIEIIPKIAIRKIAWRLKVVIISLTPSDVYFYITNKDELIHHSTIYSDVLGHFIEYDSTKLYLKDFKFNNNENLMALIGDHFNGMPFSKEGSS